MRHPERGGRRIELAVGEGPVLGLPTLESPTEEVVAEAVGCCLRDRPPNARLHVNADEIRPPRRGR